MKKRIISLILVLALCLSLLPLAAMAADGEPADDALQQPTDALRDTGSTGEGTHADHYYCGGAACTHSDPLFENATPIASAERLLAAEAGSYYLTADIDLSGTWTPQNGTVLCLNGKVLALRNAVGAVIHVAQGSTFTLLDCGAGKITHRGSSSGHGMRVDGTFYMYGGSITNNYGYSIRNEYAGGMYVSGTGKFYMYGGSINNNKFSASDPNAPHISGVLVATGGTIELSRDADISDNGIMDDIYLCNGVKIAIGAGGLTSDNRFYTRMQYSPPYGSGETAEITYPTDTDVSRYFQGGGGSYCFINERPSDHVVLVTAGLDSGTTNLTAAVSPTTLTLAQGTSGTLTMEARAKSGYSYAYQWYQNTWDGIWGGTELPGATDRMFNVPDTLPAGTHYYYCTVFLYNSAGGIVQQQNDKAVVTVKRTALTVTQNNWTYGDAEPPRPTVTGLPEGVTLEQATVTYSVKDANNYSPTVPTNRGTYTVKVEYTDQTDSLTYSGTADFTIAKKQITPPAADTTKFAYTALEQTYQLAANAAYTVSSNTTQTDADSYTVTVSLNDTANTEWTDGTTAAKEYTFTIAPATLTVTVLDKEIVAGEDAPDLNSPVEGKDYTVEGLLGADALTQVTMSYNETPDTSKAGTYTINIAATLKNYDIATVSGVLTILPAPPQRQPMGITAPGRVPGGTIELRPKNAAPGQTVTILTTPDKGYELGGLTVRDIDGERLDLTDEGGGEFTFVMPKSSVTVTGYFVREGEALFRDVPVNAYYYAAVRWAKQNGITNGIGDGLFGSTLPCTRAQIVTFLWRAAGSPEPKSAANFTDVPASAYYARAVAWAVEAGITNGVGNGKFDPDAPCTRAQCVALLYRAAGSPKVSDTADFEDVAETAYYAGAVAWAQKHGITDGVSATRFAPDHDCTRAQIVAFLYRVFAE
ncbi:MAG: S-layer homology domain-containing protein [Clostridiales bacterium]|nr:S-layer homology domain-containing protein [Clostridiales bacterium]